jgi:hypothetical protein
MSDRVASALRNSKKQEEKLIFKKIYSPPYTLSLHEMKTKISHKLSQISWTIIKILSQFKPESVDSVDIGNNIYSESDYLLAVGIVSNLTSNPGKVFMIFTEEMEMFKAKSGKYHNTKLPISYIAFSTFCIGNAATNVSLSQLQIQIQEGGGLQHGGSFVLTMAAMIGMFFITMGRADAAWYSLSVPPDEMNIANNIAQVSSSAGLTCNTVGWILTWAGYTSPAGIAMLATCTTGSAVVTGIAGVTDMTIRFIDHATGKYPLTDEQMAKIGIHGLIKMLAAAPAIVDIAVGHEAILGARGIVNQANKLEKAHAQAKVLSWAAGVVDAGVSPELAAARAALPAANELLDKVVLLELFARLAAATPLAAAAAGMTGDSKEVITDEMKRRAFAIVFPDKTPDEIFDKINKGLESAGRAAKVSALAGADLSAQLMAAFNAAKPTMIELNDSAIIAQYNQMLMDAALTTIEVYKKARARGADNKVAVAEAVQEGQVQIESMKKRFSGDAKLLVHGDRDKKDGLLGDLGNIAEGLEAIDAGCGAVQGILPALGAAGREVVRGVAAAIKGGAKNIYMERLSNITWTLFKIASTFEPSSVDSKDPGNNVYSDEDYKMMIMYLSHHTTSPQKVAIHFLEELEMFKSKTGKYALSLPREFIVAYTFILGNSIMNIVAMKQSQTESMKGGGGNPTANLTDMTGMLFTSMSRADAAMYGTPAEENIAQLTCSAGKMCAAVTAALSTTSAATMTDLTTRFAETAPLNYMHTIKNMSTETETLLGESVTNTYGDAITIKDDLTGWLPSVARDASAAVSLPVTSVVEGLISHLPERTRDDIRDRLREHHSRYKARDTENKDVEHPNQIYYFGAALLKIGWEVGDDLLQGNMDFYTAFKAFKVGYKDMYRAVTSRWTGNLNEEELAEYNFLNTVLSIDEEQIEDKSYYHFTYAPPPPPTTAPPPGWSEQREEFFRKADSIRAIMIADISELTPAELEARLDYESLLSGRKRISEVRGELTVEEYGEYRIVKAILDASAEQIEKNTSEHASFVRAVRLLFSTEKSKLSSEELEYRLRFERLLFKMKYVPTPVSNVPDILESMDKEINNEGMCSA